MSCNVSPFSLGGLPELKESGRFTVPGSSTQLLYTATTTCIIKLWCNSSSTTSIYVKINGTNPNVNNKDFEIDSSIISLNTTPSTTAKTKILFGASSYVAMIVLLMETNDYLYGNGGIKGSDYKGYADYYVYY